MDENERTLLHSPLTFDASTFELWSTLLNGGTVVLAPRRSLSVEDFRTLVAEHNITTLWLTSGLFHLVARHSIETFGALRHLIVGGDVIHANLFALVKQRFPKLRLVNGYGPTENTTFTACYVASEGFSGSKVPIGEPIAGTSIYILDEAGAPITDDAPGELATGGAGVALGYLNDHELTAKRFVADPTQSSENARMYLTGDLVRRVAGQLDFLGRKDSEIKLAGQRVQLDEVEQAILRSGPISACSVLAVEGEIQDKLLVAFVVWQNAEDEEALRAELKKQLPHVAIPRIFRSIERLPLTENGKVNRALLGKNFLQDAVSPALTVEQPSSLEDRRGWLEKITGIWSRILHRQTIDTRVNFFDLGGDSLSLVVMQAELQKLSPNAPSIVELFSLPHVESIADFMHANSLGQEMQVKQLRSPAMALNVQMDHAGEPA
jgi:acyl-coenzyme A synthetase/AMP-(fatty) acid ligase